MTEGNGDKVRYRAAMKAAVLLLCVWVLWQETVRLLASRASL